MEEALHDIPALRAQWLFDEIEHAKTSNRAQVEHPFRIIKRQFGFLKTRYRGLKKNTTVCAGEPVPTEIPIDASRRVAPLNQQIDEKRSETVCFEASHADTFDALLQKSSVIHSGQ